MIREDLRNVAIIAHVDHGKTTLVDGMLRQSGTFRDNQQVQTCVMDSGALERERGITILAKNTSVHWNGVKINIIDTPGHADFSGEVERVLKMVSGVLLLVDAAEGPMPQTRFVVEKALELGLKIIIVINKIDRPDARLAEVGDEVLELLLDLGADDDQLMSPILYCSGKNATATRDYNVPGTDLKPLFETILDYVEPPEGDPDGDLQLLVSAIDYNEYVGRIGIGKIERGTVKVGEEVMVCDYTGISPYKSKVVTLFQIEGLKRVSVDEAQVGDIVCFSGIENITIGNTLCVPSKIDPVPFVKIGEPTIEMNFSVNDSPFAGKEGKFVTSRQLRDRLFRELLKDVSLRVYQTESPDTFKVCGRGEMHLSILIETMRREGYEFGVGTPQVIFRTIDGEKCEPYGKAVHRRAVRVRRFRHGAHGRAQGRAGHHGAERQPHKDGIRRAVARTVRLQERVPHRHQGRGGHEPALRGIRALQGADTAQVHRISRRVRNGRGGDVRALQPRRSAARSSSIRRPWCTKAWWSACRPRQRTSASTCASASTSPICAPRARTRRSVLTHPAQVQPGGGTGVPERRRHAGSHSQELPHPQGDPLRQRTPETAVQRQTVRRRRNAAERKV